MYTILKIKCIYIFQILTVDHNVLGNFVDVHVMTMDMFSTESNEKEKCLHQKVKNL